MGQVTQPVEEAVDEPGDDQRAHGPLYEPIGDEAACLAWLWETLYAPDGAGAVCRRCRTVRRFHRVSRRRAYACDHCGAQIYPTAGTFMEGSGLSVATWFCGRRPRARPKTGAWPRAPSPASWGSATRPLCG